MLKKAFIKTTQKTFQIEKSVLPALTKLEVEWNKIKKTKIDNLKKILKILPILKQSGTLVFANSARAGFVSISILNSLRDINLIKQKDFDNFMSSLKTVSKKYLEDLYLLKKGKINLKTFFVSYGHLRPNTYNIKSKKYADLNFKRIIANSISKKFNIKQS